MYNGDVDDKDVKSLVKAVHLTFFAENSIDQLSPQDWGRSVVSSLEIIRFVFLAWFCPAPIDDLGFHQEQDI